MKKWKFLIITLLGLSLATFSCKKDVEPEKQSEILKKYLEIKAKTSAFNVGVPNMDNCMSAIGNSQFLSGSLNAESVRYDSAYYTEPGPGFDSTVYYEFISCAVITETKNANGTITTIYDYGEGCDEYGSFTSGKISYTWSNTGSDYYSKVVYEDYYSYGVTMNGYSEYSFKSDGNSYYEYDTLYNKGDTDDSIYYIMPAIWWWSGTSVATENITMKFDDGSILSYTSDYENKMDNRSSTTIRGEFYYVNESEGYSYSYSVVKPIINNYECTESWVPVSGIESTVFIENGITTGIETDYGNGECDNLAKITENGVSEIVDFGKLIFEYADDAVTTISSPGRKK